MGGAGVAGTDAATPWFGSGVADIRTTRFSNPWLCGNTWICARMWVAGGEAEDEVEDESEEVVVVVVVE